MFGNGYGYQPFDFSQFQQPMGGSQMLGQGLLGGGMAPTDPTQQQQGSGHHKGLSPLMALSPLLGMFMSGHPNIGLGMISPSLGIARAMGLFK